MFYKFLDWVILLRMNLRIVSGVVLGIWYVVIIRVIFLVYIGVC